MATVERLDKLIAALRAKALRVGSRKVNVAVGYSQSYALKVHEDLQAFHRVGQAKYLEQPARQIRKGLGGRLKAQLRAKRTLTQALLIEGLRLQRESQLLVPVDTGALKASAFTRLE